jgi:hypothetical protein
MATAVAATKDIVVANLVDFWRGDSNSMSVIDFLSL